MITKTLLTPLIAEMRGEVWRGELLSSPLQVKIFPQIKSVVVYGGKYKQRRPKRNETNNRKKILNFLRTIDLKLNF